MLGRTAPILSWGSELVYGRGVRRFRHEEVVIVEIAIHAAGNFRSFGAEGGTTAFEEHDDHNMTNVGFGVRGKPPETRARMGTGSGLAQNFFLAEIDA